MVGETWWANPPLLTSSSVTTITAFVFLFFTLHHAQAGFTLEQGIPHFNTKPYFLPPPSKNVTGLEGQSAYLHCRVAQLGDKKVSWIRRRDLHVLTSGVQTFASDQRFLALHAERSENWTLQIRFSQVRDSGEYQCQVNTDPRISTIFRLHVLEAATLMEGSDQRYVRAGSTIQLTCRTATTSQSPGLLYWYRDSEILQQGGRFNISTSLQGETVSRLTVQAATVTDSGNYTCWPTKFLPASVMVHVKTEEKAAAKSPSTGTNGSPPLNTQEVKTSACCSSLTTAFTKTITTILLMLLLTWGSTINTISTTTITTTTIVLVLQLLSGWYPEVLLGLLSLLAICHQAIPAIHHTLSVR